MRHLLLQDWLGDIGNLHAGAILDDTQQNVPLLKSAGCALIEYTDEMGPWVDAFLSARAGSPLAQLGPLLMAAGVWGGDGGGPISIRRLVDADGVPGTGPLTGILVFAILAEDIESNVVWLEDSGEEIFKFAQLPTTSKVGDRVRVISLPTPGGAADSTVYVGTFPNPGSLVFNGEPLEGPGMELPSGNGATLTHIADDEGAPVWEVVMDYPIGGEGGGVEPHAHTHDPDGSDPLSAFAIDVVAPYEMNLAYVYAQGNASQMLGNETAFWASVVCRLEAIPFALECIFGNYNGGNGGWFVGANGTGWVVGVAQQSDGAMLQSDGTGAAAFEHQRGGRLFRWHQVSAWFDGTTMRLMVDGEVVASLTPDGGMLIANGVSAPRVGRNGFGGDVAQSFALATFAYGEPGVDGWALPYEGGLRQNYLRNAAQRRIGYAVSVGDSVYEFTAGANFAVTDNRGNRADFISLPSEFYGSISTNAW